MNMCYEKKSSKLLQLLLRKYRKCISCRGSTWLQSVYVKGLRIIWICCPYVAGWPMSVTYGTGRQSLLETVYVSVFGFVNHVYVAASVSAGGFNEVCLCKCSRTRWFCRGWEWPVYACRWSVLCCSSSKLDIIAVMVIWLYHKLYVGGLLYLLVYLDAQRKENDRMEGMWTLGNCTWKKPRRLRQYLSA